ncbi:MAG: hypothetical protein WBA77_01845 [Microcoleaceae cyanobacterium]
MATIYFGDRQSLSDRGQEIYKKLSICIYETALSNFFEVTEGKAIAEAQNIIALKPEKVRME